ncbi:carbonic anhydrase [Dehalogenimonas sp. 4OHTPN]|uniref:Carbonic anhydrase n=1 Tax=Dehalogenimonas sp. 4OHTPN TaxID=3166643 RepID=A0AAU8GDC1_9CHLR
MEDFERLIAGFKVFREKYFSAESPWLDTLQQGQNPKTMIIGCSDSRVDPAMLTNSVPGDIFVVRNVANLVPPYEVSGGQHGVSAALEFAVCHLLVEHIIVLGHSQCGGINALMADTCGYNGGGFITRWMNIAAPARERVLADLPDKKPEFQQQAVEQASILLSLENLHSFPFIAHRVSEGALSLHGWYFNLKRGDLLEYHAGRGVFETLTS